MGISAVVWDAPARAELKNMDIAEVDFGNLNDGIYAGEYRGTKNNLRDVAVEVTVESGVVTEIAIIGGAHADENETQNNHESNLHRRIDES